MATDHKAVEVNITTEGGKAVIEGKTSVPFKTFVGLILQRKVQTLFKDLQNDPVIVGSELLTRLASAPDDKQEDRNKLVIVTFATGSIVGLFLTIAFLLGVSLFEIYPTKEQFSLVLAVLAVVGLTVWLMLRTSNRGGKPKFYEKMEKITELVSK